MSDFEPAGLREPKSHVCEFCGISVDPPGRRVRSCKPCAALLQKQTFEAGRLAAIRAEVERALDLPGKGLRAELAFWRGVGPGIRRWDGGFADNNQARLEMQVADLDRWLEATR